MKVQLVYAPSVDLQISLEVSITPHTTIRGVIEKSGILTQCPELSLSTMVVGIFGDKKTLSDRVNSNDRVEIYRPLTQSPMEARKLRY